MNSISLTVLCLAWMLDNLWRRVLNTNSVWLNSGLYGGKVVIKTLCFFPQYPLYSNIIALEMNQTIVHDKNIALCQCPTSQQNLYKLHKTGAGVVVFKTTNSTGRTPYFMVTADKMLHLFLLLTFMICWGVLPSLTFLLIFLKISRSFIGFSLANTGP